MLPPYEGGVREAGGGEQGTGCGRVVGREEDVPRHEPPPRCSVGPRIAAASTAPPPFRCSASRTSRRRRSAALRRGRARRSCFARGRTASTSPLCPSLGEDRVEGLERKTAVLLGLRVDSSKSKGLNRKTATTDEKQWTTTICNII